MTAPYSEVSSDSKRKLIELLVTTGGVLGIITAFLHPTLAIETAFAIAIVVFITASVRAYTGLLTNQTDIGYVIAVGLMLGALWGLLAGLVEIVVADALATTSNLLDIGVYLIAFLAVAVLTFHWVYNSVYQVLTSTP